MKNDDTKNNYSNKIGRDTNNLSCRTENGRSAVADLLISAAPPTPFPKQFAGSQTFDQSMLAYQCQSYKGARIEPRLIICI